MGRERVQDSGDGIGHKVLNKCVISSSDMSDNV